MTVPDPAPTAEDVIAETIHRGVCDGWVYDSPVERSLAMWDPRPTTAAVVAAVRAMSVETLAELIGGELIDRVTFGGRRIRYVCSPPDHGDPS